MKKALFRGIGVLTLFGILTIIYVILTFNPYSKVINSADDDIPGNTYFKLYKVILPNKQFDSLLVKLICENDDDLSVASMATNYAINHKKCFLINPLQGLTSRIHSYRVDSPHYTKNGEKVLVGGYFVGGMPFDGWDTIFNNYLIDLKTICDNSQVK